MENDLEKNELNHNFLCFCSLLCIINGKKLNLPNIFLLVLKNETYKSLMKYMLTIDNDYDLLKDMVAEKVKAIICMGVDNAKIHEAFRDVVNTIIDTASAEEAVKKAYDVSEKGDVVLLSPACASFDLFKNYEDRGEQFKKAVKEL